MVRVNNRHKTVHYLTRHGSGSFTVPDAAKYVAGRSKGPGGRFPPRSTETSVANELWARVDAGMLTARHDEKSLEWRLKATPETARHLKRVREQCGQGDSPVKHFNLLQQLTGPVPRHTKRQLYEKAMQLRQRQTLGAGPQENAQPVGGDDDVFMDLGPQDVHQQQLEPILSGSSGGVTGERAPPRTPQRLRPTQSYLLTPPNTNSPLSRQATQVRFEQRTAASSGGGVGVPDDQQRQVEQSTAASSGDGGGLGLLEEQPRQDKPEAEVMTHDELAELRQRNAALVVERDTGRRKYWGAEAALKGLRGNYEKEEVRHKKEEVRLKMEVVGYKKRITALRMKIRAFLTEHVLSALE